MKSIKTLSPKPVFAIFEQITRIARPSKQETQILEYIKTFADERKLVWKQDAKGNVVVRKPATKGYETKAGVVLQSHVDMVCEKDAAVVHDFSKDPIAAYVDGDWVRARGTTLGADCGIGMALQMAVLAAGDEVAHPALEALFTVDEEQGLSGAMGLGADMLSFTKMINLDSEDEGEIFIGCAGGVDTIARFEYKAKKAPDKGYKYYDLSVSGLTGGHSGDDIEKGRANANKLLARFLWEFLSAGDVRLALIDGGNLRNAIARDAAAVVGVPKDLQIEINAMFTKLSADIAAEFRHTERAMSLTFEPSAEVPENVISRGVSHLLVAALVGVPNGVQSMSHAIKDLVETSTNLASIKMMGDEIVVVTSQRSSVESAKHAVAAAVESVFLLAEADVEHTDGYPGWEPRPSSELVKGAAAVYKKLFGRAAKIKAIHAGLECGLFLEKYPDLDMISVGPTIRDPHSPSERLEIASVQKAWDFLLSLLAL